MSNATYEGKMPTIDDFCENNKTSTNILNSRCYCFTEEEFQSAKSRQMLQCKCAWCQNIFLRDKHSLQKRIYNKNKFITCSPSCSLRFKALTLSQKELGGYYCETCGHFVSLINSYGSKRFCSIQCAKKYAHSFAMTEKAVAKKQQTNNNKFKDLQIFDTNHQFIILSVSDINLMQEKWSLIDIPKYLHIDKLKFLSFTYRQHINEKTKYINPRKYKVIEACRNFLNKPIEQGSITIEDFESVRKECTRLIQEEDVTAKEISLKYLKLDKHNSSFLYDCLHIDLLSSAEALCQFHLRKGTYNNWTELKKYRARCRFTYMHNLLSFIPGYELLERYGWYDPKNNLNGVSRDHMISIQYGWEHHIDPYLISHPANCMLLQMKENSSKQDKCSLTLQELIERVEWFNNTILCCKERNRCSIKTNLKFHCSDIFSQNEIKHFSMLAYE